MTPGWMLVPAAQPDAQMSGKAVARQAQLTKPPGALGRLEHIAVHLAGLQCRAAPAVERVAITVFAADHGVVAEGVSAFPQSVTAAMIGNFLQGGAAISVLADALDARLEIVDLGTAVPVAETPQRGRARLVRRCIAAGTENFCAGPAMTPAQLGEALDAGRDAVDAALVDGAELFIGGDMGIGNTTSAAALACLLLEQSPEVLVGPGSGVDAAGLARKKDVVARALARHVPAAPLEALRRVGGFEIAALAGAFVRAAQRGLPVLVDGFICSVAALAALRLRPDAAPWLLYAHSSAEPGHRRVLAALAAEPLLDLGMRLGEASGAAVAVPLLRLACALHNRMATFAEAGVADGA